MIDAFVLLAPIFLLGIIALLGFVGCDQVLGLVPVSSGVTPLQAVLTNQSASGNPVQAQASLGKSPGSELVVVTVQWGGTGLVTLSPAMNLVEKDSFSGPAGQVATYYAFVDLSNGLTVTASVPSSPETDLSLLVSAYDNVDAGGPVNPTSQQKTFATPTTLSFPISSQAPGDLIYAVAIERKASGGSAGSWSPGAGFTAYAGAGNFIMLEYQGLQQTDINAGSVNVTATDSTALNTYYWYLFAMALPQA